MTERELRVLRFSAGLVYINDVFGNISVSELTEYPEFNGIRVKTLERWAIEDQWSAQRREQQARLKHSIEDRLRNELIELHMRQLGDMQKVYDRANLFLLSKDGPAPRSFEQLGNLMVKLSERMDTLRIGLLEKLTPAPSPDDEDGKKEPKRRMPDEMLPKLNKGDALAAAHAILAARQEAAGALPAPPSEEDTGDGQAVDS
jgi:hypothetical protein